MQRVELAQGPINYRETGRGEPILFVHGALVDGTLWRKVTPALERDHRCIVPDWPLGSHREAMHPGADLSPPGLARIVADFAEALDLERVTLVGNDTGGAICQVLATRHPERLGRLALTNCDAYDNFLPPAFRYLQLVARLPGGVAAMAQTMRFDLLRRAPIAYGWLSKRPVPREVLDGWTAPLAADSAIRRDTAKVLRGISKRYTLEAAELLRDFDRPVLLAWGREDRFFSPAYAERLAAAIPGARLVWIDDARTFVSEDQPERLAELLGEFAGATGP
jgi:pimeloyl-ACP methyl ester carboxylesterase